MTFTGRKIDDDFVLVKKGTTFSLYEFMIDYKVVLVDNKTDIIVKEFEAERKKCEIELEFIRYNHFSEKKETTVLIIETEYLYDVETIHDNFRSAVLEKAVSILEANRKGNNHKFRVFKEIK